VCGQQCVSPPFIHSKSRMRKRARTDLRGGRSAMVVPTATVIQMFARAFQYRQVGKGLPIAAFVNSPETRFSESLN